MGYGNHRRNKSACKKIALANCGLYERRIIVVMYYVYLTLGLLLLIKGVDVFVDAASKVAKIAGVPAFIVGLSIVAFGTSAPEAAIGFFSALKQTSEITLGDVIGSSITNIALIAGVTALIDPVKVEPVMAKREMPLSFSIQLLLVIMMFTGLVISRMEAVLLLIAFCLFVLYLAINTKKLIRAKIPHNQTESDVLESLEYEEKIQKEQLDERIAVKRKSGLGKQLILFAAGLVATIAGGNLIVDNAVLIADSMGIRQEFIGVTVIALGTSLPELLTCIVAAVKKKEEIAVGNVIGSNIFNILFVLGLSGIIYPIAVSPEIFLDVAFMLLATIAIFLPSILYNKLSRFTGAALIGIYLIFNATKIILLL